MNSGEGVYYLGKRVLDMTREELIDTLVFLQKANARLLEREKQAKDMWAETQKRRVEEVKKDKSERGDDD